MKDWLAFADPAEEREWHAVNDGVMGGVSAGSFSLEGDRGVFHGTLSLEHGGGFASVRRAVPEGALAGTDGVSMRLLGDGRRYQCRVGTDQLPDGASYTAGFDTVAGELLDVTLPWDEFAAIFRGRPIRDAPPLSPGRISRFGLLLADGQPGTFRLELSTVRLV